MFLVPRWCSRERRVWTTCGLGHELLCALIGIPLSTAPGLGYDLAAIAAAAQPRAEATMILAERGERSIAAAIASACALAAVI